MCTPRRRGSPHAEPCSSTAKLPLGGALVPARCGLWEWWQQRCRGTSVPPSAGALTQPRVQIGDEKRTVADMRERYKGLKAKVVQQEKDMGGTTAAQHENIQVCPAGLLHAGQHAEPSRAADSAGISSRLGLQCGWLHCLLGMHCTAHHHHIHQATCQSSAVK